MKADILEVTGCVDCAFSNPLYDGCDHPKASAAVSRTLQGYWENEINSGKTPRACPLRKAELVIKLKRRKA